MKRWLVFVSLICAVGLWTCPCAAQGSTAPDLPLVWVLATGGTIAGQSSSPTNLAEYKPGSLGIEELVDRVPEIRRIARVKTEQIANVGSSDLTIDHWLTLAGRINTIFAGDPSMAGIDPADTLNPQKARVLLMLALTKTSDPAEIRRMFAQY